MSILLLMSCAAYTQDTMRISLLFAGDIMQHDSQIRAAFDEQYEKYNYQSCFQYIKPLVSQADVAIGNLELTLAGPPYKGYPQFSAPDELAVGLKDAGFDILVTANNHSLDRRKKGLERTNRILDSLEIMHTGTFRDSTEKANQYPLMIEKRGFRISLLNYTYGTNGIPVTKPNRVNFIDTTSIKKDISIAKSQKPDAIIVFMHWGDEYQNYPNENQKRLSAFCFENGAKLVIGAHPHVLQPMEWNKEKDQLVAYSLGNFISGQQSRFRDGGAMLMVELEKVENDSLLKTTIKHAAYDLVWAYRNNESPKKYFILPVKEFEQDTLLLKGAAFDALKLFTDDSRKLLSNNVNIDETNRQLLEMNYYKIVIEPLPRSQSIDSVSIMKFYSMKVEDQDSLALWSTGKFFDLDVAQQALKEIQSQTEFSKAKIIWYYWGRRIELVPGEDYPD